MIGTTLLATALRLPHEDWQALTQGRAIATMPWNFISPGQSFALCSDDFLRANNFKARFWARCELCQSIDRLDQLDMLSKLTMWTKQTVESKLAERGFFFLAYLRVYELSEPSEVSTTTKGDFLPLRTPITLVNSLPVISDRTFAQRKHQLENLEPPEHPELEALHSAIAQLTPTNSAAIHLEQDLKCFLGWADSATKDFLNSDKTWIREIARAGNSSDGDYFEKLVRKSFIELGFTNSRNNPKMSLDPDVTGGAGGIDFFCDAPYLIIGECKASKHKKVNDNKEGAPAQLMKYGGTYLSTAEFDNCIRIIMAPGELTEYADRTANGNKMNVLQPETLQRLVELKQAYPGAINLWELKSCLAQAPFSQAADDKVNEFIDRIQLEIKVRSRIVQLLQNRAPQELGLEFIWGIYEAIDPPRSLTQDQLKEILIELSSPLTGFIGRKEGDRFYFLRPLMLET
ncbi:DUF1802 family protein [Leptolyngbya sp. NIES-2104]|uniref:DUF1802 family protein n=1 Tax=Leptolyngbya sp. NIES-2104 TaxID=1552121 RepID=UPI0006EC77C6|nr:DUF1802 family protein [Leptolyngbya sp. NIES-2104]GAP98603.1 hypothetical protein NIES2104_51580 [Leptolyngbya sp. NIES-2104]